MQLATAGTGCVVPMLEERRVAESAPHEALLRQRGAYLALMEGRHA